MSTIVKKSHNLLSSLILPALLLLGFASSCNEKSDLDDTIIVVTPSTVAVSDFTLTADSKVMSNLDSVFFSIDLNRGVIFNADSLPKGTSVRKLIPVITFANTMSAAELVFTDSLGSEKTVNYLETKTDSIDFTNDVLLNVTAADGKNKFTYIIKVNVHKEVPDSLVWDKMAMSTLPSRNASPLQQKSVMCDETLFTIIEESDHSFTLAQSENLAEGYSSKQELTLPFAPDIESLAATPDAFYMLDKSGMLYSSANLTDWTSTGEQWIAITGPYAGSVLGVKSTDRGLMHCHYPASELITDTAVDKDFPISGRSSLGTVSNKWSPQPTVFFVGGTTADGRISSHTWAFDGSIWTTIDESALPAMDGVAIVKYIVYRSTQYLFVEHAYEAWFAFGGKFEDGSLNKTLYYSYDNGVTWTQAPELMQLPDYLPALYNADIVTIKTNLNGNLSDIWTKTPSKIASRASDYVIVGDDISWDCPYLYIIGGDFADGSLSDAIWRGVLSRLTFTPLF